METINVENYAETRFNTAIALGNFDGVHIGHQKLILEMIRISNEKKLKKSILLFENHTKTFLDGIGPRLLTSPEQKKDLIKDLGVEIVYSMYFNENIMKLSPERFVSEILVDKLGVKAIVVGTNYRFGHKASGDAKLLKKIGEKYGIEVKIFEPIYFNNDIVSSTRIRNSLINSELADSKIMLGRDYSIYGKVVPGKRIGNKLGFPTANIQPNVNYVLPTNGVYSTLTIVDGIKYLSATSIGFNPTFKEESIKIESHIIDFEADIYEKIVELKFIEYLRQEIKFENIELLKGQIKADINRVKNR